MKGFPEILFFFLFSVPCLSALCVIDMEILNSKYIFYPDCRECPASSDSSLFFPFSYPLPRLAPFIIISRHTLLLPLSSSPQASR